jgi:hypothetical protein
VTWAVGRTHIERLDEVEIVLGDLIIVLFDLLKRLLVIANQLVDVQVFSLFDFVDLHLRAKKQTSNTPSKT